MLQKIINLFHIINNKSYLYKCNIYFLPKILPSKMQRIKTIILTHTTVAPIGVDQRIESIIPVNAQRLPIIAEAITTEKKLLTIRSAESTGNTISAEIRSEPTSCMLSTITTAIIIARRYLYNFDLIPVAAAKFSSKVTANILW